MRLVQGAEPFAFSSLDVLGRRRHGLGVRLSASIGTSMQRVSSEPSELDEAWSTLMIAAQDGDKAAYGRLLRECTPLIRRIVRRGLRSDQVDDVVQEVLLTIHRARHTYDPARSFSAWVIVLAQRRAIDFLRRSGRSERREIHSPIEYEQFAEAPVDPNRDLSRDQESGALRTALESLPPRQRQAIEALALRQLSLEEAAGETGRSKVALKVSMHRALNSLRGRFGGSSD